MSVELGILVLQPAVGVEEQQPLTMSGRHSQLERLLAVMAEVDPVAEMHLASNPERLHKIDDLLGRPVAGAGVDDDEVIDHLFDRRQCPLDG